MKARYKWEQGSFLKKGLILLGILILALLLGAMVGISIGGGNPFEVFVPSTWSHLFSFLG